MSALTFNETLKLEHVFKAPIERVFAAWTNAEMLAQWFGPEHFSVVNVEANCQKNGRYDITFESPDKNLIRHYGVYLEVDKPTTLIFTWEIENQSCQGSVGHKATTIVELNFIPQGQTTLLQLKHEKLPDDVAFNGHRFGWMSSFDSLSTLLEQQR